MQRLCVSFVSRVISFCFFLVSCLFLAAEDVEAIGEPRFHRAAGTLLTIQYIGQTF